MLLEPKKRDYIGQQQDEQYQNNKICGQLDVRIPFMVEWRRKYDYKISWKVIEYDDSLIKISDNNSSSPNSHEQ